MKIGVFGLWHLGSVTAACLAEAGYETVGIDPDPATIARLRTGRAPLFEPGLDPLIEAGIASARLSFSSGLADASGCDLIWVAFDTPVDDNDVADTAFVISKVESLSHVKDGAVILISSQLPVGSTGGIAKAYRQRAFSKTLHFAYSPENLRLGQAIEVFKKAERIIVGYAHERVRDVLDPVLRKFTSEVVWTKIESAEMVKHAVNGFLATCVTFANEIATVCEHVGADAGEVERALRLEPRIGRRAYIRPGAAFAGGTLARDVRFLGAIAKKNGIEVPLIESIIPSNAAHRRWPIHRLVQCLGSVAGRTISMLGLAYKPGTDTLRRSWSVEMCRELADLGAHVQAFDPAVTVLPEEVSHFVRAKTSIESALKGSEAAIIATEWPEFKAINPDLCVRMMKSPVIIDPNRFLTTAFENVPKVAYFSVGRS